MIKTADDIPNSEVGRYLATAIGALSVATKILNNRVDYVSDAEILEFLNDAMQKNKEFVSIDPPPAVVRVDLMVAALEDRLEDAKDYLLDGLKDAIEVIKEFKGVEI